MSVIRRVSTLSEVLQFNRSAARADTSYPGLPTMPSTISFAALPDETLVPPALAISPAASRWLRPRVRRNGLGRVGLMVRYGPTDAYDRSATIAYSGCELPCVWRVWTSRTPQPPRQLAGAAERVLSLAHAALALIA